MAKQALTKRQELLLDGAFRVGLLFFEGSQLLWKRQHTSIAKNFEDQLELAKASLDFVNFCVKEVAKELETKKNVEG